VQNPAPDILVEIPYLTLLYRPCSKVPGFPHGGSTYPISPN